MTSSEESIDIADARLLPYVDLRHAGTRPGGLHFIAEGRLLVQRLIASDFGIESVLVQRGLDEPWKGQLDPSTPVYSLSREQLKQLVGFDFHRGVIACGRRKPVPSASEFRFRVGEVPLALAVIGVSELENLGSLFRSAAGFGIRDILIGPGTADPFSRRVIRVSMGNVFQLRLYEMDDPASQLSELVRERNVRTVATTPDHNATTLDKFSGDDRGVILMVGNESTGLDPDLLRRATDRVAIAMRLGTDSLNVSVAAAVFMYHLTTIATPKSDGP